MYESGQITDFVSYLGLGNIDIAIWWDDSGDERKFGIVGPDEHERRLLSDDEACIHEGDVVYHLKWTGNNIQVVRYETKHQYITRPPQLLFGHWACPTTNGQKRVLFVRGGQCAESLSDQGLKYHLMSSPGRISLGCLYI
jgi:hypothetical protein